MAGGEGPGVIYAMLRAACHFTDEDPKPEIDRIGQEIITLMRGSGSNDAPADATR